jgi:hypothetical protein
MIKIELPFWLDGPELAKLVTAATNFFTLAETWIKWPLGQMSALTCSEGILELLAYQRDIQRFTNEPINLYRNRVHYALVNAQDAGSKAGFIRIFERLGIGYVEISERFDATNWDVIGLKLSNSQISGNAQLLGDIILKYGRTCRRYTFDTLVGVPPGITTWGVGHTWAYSAASI